MICLSLVVIVGFVGQISVVQLALAGVAGFTMSHLTTDVGGFWAEFPISLLIGAASATVRRSPHRGLGSARPRRQSRRWSRSRPRSRSSSSASSTRGGAAAPRARRSRAASSAGSTCLPGRPSEAWTTRFRARSSASSSSRRRSCSHCSSPTCGARAWASGCSPCARTSAQPRLPGSTSATRSSPGFGIAAFIAGMAGALYAYNFGSVSYSRFGALTALGLIAFAYFGGITMVSGAVIAGVGATEGLLPHAFDEWFGLSGNWALLDRRLRVDRHPARQPGGHCRNRIQEEAAEEEAARRGGRPTGTRLPARDRSARRARARATAGSDESQARPSSPRPESRSRSAACGRSTRSTSTVSEGQLVGLIGPNGAGKTTFIDAISGFVPYRGRVELDGQGAGRAGSARPRRARAREDMAVDRAVRRPERAREPGGRLATALRRGPRRSRCSRGR